MAIVNRVMFRCDVLAFLFCIALFGIWPQLDLIVSKLFYLQTQGHFIAEGSLWVRPFYLLFAYIHIPLLLTLFGLVVFYSYRRRKSLKWKSVFLIVCLVAGPGVLVNAVLKNHSVGRARPSQTLDFGSIHHFTSPFEYSGACRKNCSFTSGHAAIGFFIIAFSWVSRRQYFYAGVAVGGLLGLMRMAQGAHFLSDVIFSFWAVYWMTYGLGFLLKYPWPHGNLLKHSDSELNGKPAALLPASHL